MHCPNCNEENVSSAKFCKKCGNSLLHIPSKRKDANMPEKNKQVVELLKKAFALKDEKKYQEAAICAKQAIGIDNSDPISWGILGDTHYCAELYNEAISEYKKVVMLDPFGSEGYAKLGMAYLKQGKLADAKTNLEGAIEFDAENILAIINLGIIMKQEKQYIEALDFFQKALELNKSENNILSDSINGEIMETRYLQNLSIASGVDVAKPVIDNRLNCLRCHSSNTISKRGFLIWFFVIFLFPVGLLLLLIPTRNHCNDCGFNWK